MERNFFPVFILKMAARIYYGIKRNTIRALWILIIIAIAAPSYSYKLDSNIEKWATILGQEMKVFTEKTLAPSKIQQLYDNVDYRQYLASPQAIIDDLSQDLNATLSDIIQFIRSAKGMIESSYTSRKFLSSAHYQSCCNSIDLSYNMELNDEVNLSTPCIIFPAQNTHSYIPKALESAYHRNFVDNLSVKWQYYAGSNNIFYQYPTSKRYCNTNYPTQTKFK